MLSAMDQAQRLIRSPALADIYGGAIESGMSDEALQQ